MSAALAPIHVILLPGLDGTGELFAPFLQAIAQLEVTPFEPQLIAHALHYPTQDKMTMAQLQEAVTHYIAQQLPADARYVILGESFSGPVAILAAKVAQDARQDCAPGQRCMGLILCCSMARNPYVMFAPLAPLFSVLPIELVPMGWVNRLAQGKIDFWADGGDLAMNRVSPSVLRHRLKAISRVDVTQELASLQMPILYLQAAKDLVVPASAARLVQDCAPQTRLVRLESSHFLLQDHPEEALAQIEIFIAQMVLDGFSSLHMPLPYDEPWGDTETPAGL